MVTPKLLELIDSGQAEYKTLCTGGSGVSILKVPKNKHLIIINFTYSHFIDSVTKGIPTDTELRDNALHNVLFRSKNKKFLYLFRTNITIFTNQTLGLTFSPTNDAEDIDCYQVHDGDVAISIFKFEPISGWTTLFGPLGSLANSENLPAGYGDSIAGGANVVTQINFGAGNSQFLPQSTNSPVAPLPNYRDQFRDNIIPGATNLQDLNESNMYSFPILNINYVLINKPLK